MNNRNTNGPNFIPYDDENLEHVISGTDYGQPWSASNAWNEIDPIENPGFIQDLGNKIIHKSIKIIKPS
jgi:hypothetical protein